MISIKRAEDLADAMEARGYIPGAVRTKTGKNEMSLIRLCGTICCFDVIYFTHSWKMWSLCAIK